jgi:RNA polymerase sigma-70 factor (ECF subfamily)
MDLKTKQRLFEKEYHALFKRIYRYLRARMNSTVEAEDLVSETFVEGYRSLHNYTETSGNFEQWLVGIARHKLLEHWRRELPALDLTEFENSLEAEDAQVADHIDQSLAWTKIIQAVPVQHQPLLILKFVDDLTFEDIAKLLNKSPEAVRQSFSRLLRKLRLSLSEDNLL